METRCAQIGSQSDGWWSAVERLRPIRAKRVEGTLRLRAECPPAEGVRRNKKTDTLRLFWRHSNLHSACCSFGEIPGPAQASLPWRTVKRPAQRRAYKRTRGTTAGVRTCSLTVSSRCAPCLSINGSWPSLSASGESHDYDEDACGLLNIHDCRVTRWFISRTRSKRLCGAAELWIGCFSSPRCKSRLRFT